MKKILLLVAAFILLFGLSACKQGYTNIDNEELKVMLQNPDDYQFVDVRTTTEYYDSHVPGFKIVIDYYILVDDYSGLDKLDKDKPVVIMCNSGNRSASAAEIMISEGFTEVYNLTDGIQGWDGETE